MPYKSETAKNDGNEPSFEAGAEKDPHHPAQGAGLLLSLSSDKAAKLGSLQDNSSSSSNTMNPITPMDGFPAGAPVVGGVSAGGNHRLYHSPIKLNKESRAAEEASCCYSDHASTSSGDIHPLLSGDLHSHASRNSWSPYHHQGMGGHSYFPPPFAPFPTEDLLDKRQVSDGHDNDSPLQARSGGFGEEKKDELQGDDDEKEQPVISPASSSSNDKQDEEVEEEEADVEEDSSPSEERSVAHPHHPPQWPPHQQHHPAMYPPWQGQPGYPAAPPPTHHPSYPPPPPQYGSNGYPLPPPWFGAAPYPSYSMHQHGETAVPGANAEPKDEVDWQQVSSASLNRCLPLKHPPANRFWGNRNSLAEHTLPDFGRLVNFPDFLTKGRGSTSNATNADGKKGCVMCGNMRICSVAGRRKHDVETTHIIPRQNKGVCTQCDVTVWRVTADKIEVKWCKGCKNFRPWAAFGEKGMATKCLRCRKRQKDKYANQKKTDETTGAAKGLPKQLDERVDLVKSS